MTAVQVAMLIGALLTLFLATATACRRLSTREQACWNGEWMSRKKFDRLQQRLATQLPEGPAADLTDLTSHDRRWLADNGWREDGNVPRMVHYGTEEETFLAATTAGAPFIRGVATFAVYSPRNVTVALSVFVEGNAAADRRCAASGAEVRIPVDFLCGMSGEKKVLLRVQCQSINPLPVRIDTMTFEPEEMK